MAMNELNRRQILAHLCVDGWSPKGNGGWPLAIHGHLT